ncbi:hypothetical protein [Paenibacillus sp. FSL R5-0912]|uniref:hypothetical protein n=1 Tax=Paenibacillus sp. FSL R5-0912 TaxID=1536771 RepID=UPI0004F5A244|nr:hypothetical protein [Paenibacillus sp. FSL R5-0912]AIQ44269.1 hypothetical protein R50912_32960 [Paenibacillus sp. FSL R5-0912]
MYIPISRIQAASLTRSPHQEAHAPAESSVLSFSETLAAVAAAIEDQARRIRKKYGLSVQITAVSKDGSNSAESAGKGARDEVREIVIAPNILQQMSKDPVTLRKIYGYIDEYVAKDHLSADRSLIIYRDGTCTLSLSAPPPDQAGKSSGGPAGQPGLWSGSSTQDRLQQLAFIRARRANRQS